MFMYIRFVVAESVYLLGSFTTESHIIEKKKRGPFRGVRLT